jgi:hypothetical protein
VKREVELHCEISPLLRLRLVCAWSGSRLTECA